jgi:hypothetical protein
MKQEKSQAVNELMSLCTPLPSTMEAGELFPDTIGQFEFQPLPEVENHNEIFLVEDINTNEETIDTQTKDFQESQGALIESQDHSPFETVDESFEELDIEAIQPFGIIPDYTIPTDLKYPIVVKTPLNYFCLDGWDLIQEAKAKGNIALICNVEHIAEHSDEELALRKVSLRVKPRGGIASYSELVRNTKRLEEILLASDRDLKVFQHGGRRKGESFTKDKQENVRKVLAFRLAKSVTTINKFLNHAYLLTEETLNFLAEKGAGKDFFEEAQKNKRWQITNLRSEKVSDEAITSRISEDTMEWFDEYSKNGKKITPVWKKEAPENIGVNHTEVPLARPPEEDSIPEVSVPPVVSMETSDEIDSLEDIKLDMEALAKRLIEANGLSDPAEYYSRIETETRKFALLIQRAHALTNKTLSFSKEGC